MNKKNRFFEQSELPIHNSSQKWDFEWIVDSMNREAYRPCRSCIVWCLHTWLTSLTAWNPAKSDPRSRDSGVVTFDQETHETNRKTCDLRPQRDGQDSHDGQAPRCKKNIPNLSEVTAGVWTTTKVLSTELCSNA